ncbi:MAG: hypothetical protein JW829_10065, partial [Pirellulales bacterium]|nr:hypothetical protein [Pirellulales bacterium]
DGVFRSLEHANKAPFQNGFLLGIVPLIPSPAAPVSHSRNDARSSAQVASAEPSPEPQVSTPPKPKYEPLSGPEEDLKNRVRRVIAFYKKPRLNTRDHCPWEILHDIIANGTEAQVLVDGPTGKPITSIGWLCFNRPAHGLQLLYLKADRMGTKQGPGVQGHDGQFLAALAQARVMRNYPVHVGGREFTVEGLVQYEQNTCYSHSELTFKLIGLNHYLDPDAAWKNDRGEDWSISRMVREELAQPIHGVTCGGTHRLVAMSLAVQKRQKLGLPIDGDFARAEKVVRGYQQVTFQLQNRDGSFSTEWFRGPGSNPNLERRLRTSGHLLEWVLMTLPTDQLRHPNVQRGVAYMANLLWETRYQAWDAGYLCHAVHAMNLYDQRVFQPIEQEKQDKVVAAAPSERVQ